ncbi:MAG: argininosuccinate lyase, partial [Betaproteobacteria bacterium]|nr:argininosuccinate lyase [Betaproteobacteria bacterium]
MAFPKNRTARAAGQRSGRSRVRQPWSGRFSEPVDAFVQRFTASVAFDRRLARHDIAGSIAHA